MVRYQGGCHCGRVRFEVQATPSLTVHECNCSLCRMTGFLHLIVPQSHFHLLQGQNDLSTYTFNTHTAKHLFCKVCGVKSFYIPRSNPDGFSVNLRCLDKDQIGEVTIVPFDGENWDDNAGELRHLTQEKK